LADEEEGLLGVEGFGEAVVDACVGVFVVVGCDVD
jgi:hypothetical protein